MRKKKALKPDWEILRIYKHPNGKRFAQIYDNNAMSGDSDSVTLSKYVGVEDLKKYGLTIPKGRGPCTQRR